MRTKTSEALKGVENEKSGTQTGHKPTVSRFPEHLTKPIAEANRLPKTSVDYWKSVVAPRIIRGTPSAELYVRFRETGRDAWVNLDSPNKITAATRARDLWLNIRAKGLDVAIAEFHPKAAPRAAKAGTVGEVLALLSDPAVLRAAGSSRSGKNRSPIRASTANQYCVALRRLASAVAGMEITPAVFYHGSEESKAWRERVNAVRLDKLTAAAVNLWQTAYVDGETDHLVRARKENTAAAVLRNAKACFGPHMLKAYGDQIQLPSPAPLAGVKAGSSTRRFETKVNPRVLFAAARKELSGDTLAALTLCLFAGLRRAEADMLPRSHINLDAALVTVATTAHFKPKTTESQRTTPLAPDAVRILRAHFAVTPAADMVLDGGDPAAKRGPGEYRSPCWRDLLTWLRGKGFESPNPVHELRKLSGSLVNEVAGLEAARRHLGHRTVTTTAASYVTGSAFTIDLSARPEAVK